MNQGILVISYMITVAIYLGDVNMSRASPGGVRSRKSFFD